MTSALDTFKALLQQLKMVDNESPEADDIRDRMDPVWYAMTEEERLQARKLSAD